MIEIIYNKEEPEVLEENVIKLPKNIRQIGRPSDGKVIYIEDYVSIFIKKNYSRMRYGVLLGEVKRGNGNTYVFVSGAVEVKEKNTIPIFNEDIWSVLYETMHRHFSNLSVVGWYQTSDHAPDGSFMDLTRVHLDNFAGNDKIMFLYNQTEEDDSIYMYDSQGLTRLAGYYVYYEKNEAMQNYMVEAMSNKAVENKIDNEEKPISITSFETKKEDKKQFKASKYLAGFGVVAILVMVASIMNSNGSLDSLKSKINGLASSWSKNSDSNDDIINAVYETVYGSVQQTQEPTTKEEQTEDPSNKATQEPTTVNEQNTTHLEEPTTKAVNETVTQPETQPETVRTEVMPILASAMQYVETRNNNNYYKVQKGDTLYDISIKIYGSSKMVNSIMVVNDIDDGNLIKYGFEIQLP